MYVEFYLKLTWNTTIMTITLLYTYISAWLHDCSYSICLFLNKKIPKIVLTMKSSSEYTLFDIVHSHKPVMQNCKK